MDSIKIHFPSYKVLLKNMKLTKCFLIFITKVSKNNICLSIFMEYAIRKKRYLSTFHTQLSIMLKH